MVALFLARVAYRLARTYEATGGFLVPPSEAIKNPFTVLVAGLVMGYYSWLAWGFAGLVQTNDAFVVFKQRRLITDS